MINNSSHQHLWHLFSQRELLTDKQLEEFKLYYQELVSWNEHTNLTRVTMLEDVLAYHFSDSLAASYCIDFSSKLTIADVGSGAGFPAIPLKIKYPHLSVVIIDVSTKRLAFLKHMVEKLNLRDVQLFHIDWRTFLRKYSVHIDYIFARASLQLDELFRMFKPSSPYKERTFVYWASSLWQPDELSTLFFKKSYAYTVGLKERKLIFFSESK